MDAQKKKMLALLALGGAGLYLATSGSQEESGPQIPMTRAPSKEELARRWRQPVDFAPPGGKPVGDPNRPLIDPGSMLIEPIQDVLGPGQFASDAMFGTLAPVNSQEFYNPGSMVLQIAPESTVEQDIDEARAMMADPRTIASLHGSMTIKSSELLRFFIAKNPAVFFMPYDIPQVYEVPDHMSGRLTVEIDSWQSFRYFSHMILALMFEIGRANQKIYAPFIKFFNYHEFVIDTQGEVYKGMMATINDWACKCDERISSLWWDIDCYTGINQSDTYGCDPYNARVRNIVNATMNDGLMLMIEYASAKYASATFVSMYNPALGKQFSEQLGSAISSAVSLAAAAVAVATGAIAASSIPVVGWITGALAAIGAAIMAIIAAQGMIDKNRVMRQQISKTINGILKSTFRRGNIQDEFSGYTLDLLLPAKPPWDDIKVNDTPGGNVFHNFCLVHAGPGCCWIAPQLPFFYLRCDADFVGSLTVPAQDFLVIRPKMSWDGVTEDWTQVQTEAKNAQLDLAGSYVKPF